VNFDEMIMRLGTYKEEEQEEMKKLHQK